MNDRWVVVRQLPAGTDLRRDYTALPKNYGSDAYFRRRDIQAIRKLVFESLDTLDGHLHFTPRLAASSRAVIKPKSGFGLSQQRHGPRRLPRNPPIPGYWTRWWSGLQQYQPRVLIAESSGKPMPTRTSFKVSGIDRIARFRKTGLVALENLPGAGRYLLAQSPGDEGKCSSPSPLWRWLRARPFTSRCPS